MNPWVLTVEVISIISTMAACWGPYSKDGVPITNPEEIPPEAQKLITQYRELEEQQISYMQIGKNTLLVAIVLFGIQYLMLVLPKKKKEE